MSLPASRAREHLSITLQHARGRRQASEEITLPAADPGQHRDDLPASFGYLGDMLLRFVFTDDDGGRIVARQGDLQRLNITPQVAAVQSIVNARRDNGAPKAVEFVKGVFQLAGDTQDFNACYLLDRAFWRTQLQAFPRGVVATLPRRGCIFFADAGNAEAVDEITRRSTKLFDAAGDNRVSACVYRFDGKSWQLHADLPVAGSAAAKPPVAEAPARANRAAAVQAPVPGEEGEEAEDESRLALAAAGQKMVIYSIVANFVLSSASRSTPMPTLLVLVLYLGIAAMSLVGVLRICAGLRLGTTSKVVYVVLSFVPIVSIVALVLLSARTTKLLRSHGWTVGLFGAKT